MVFTFMVNGQWLLPKSIIPKLVQNTVEQYTLHFIMDESWTPYTAVSAAFSNDENTCEVLVKDGCALIPAQMLTQCGRLDVALKGLYNERVYRTHPFHFRVAESAADENTEAFTPALAQQVQELAQNTYAVVAGLGDSLETQRRADAAVLTAEQSAKSASQNAQSAQDAAERALVSVDTVRSAQESADAAAAAAQASCESASAFADRAEAAAQTVGDLLDRVSVLEDTSDQLKEDFNELIVLPPNLFDKQNAIEPNTGTLNYASGKITVTKSNIWISDYMPVVEGLKYIGMYVDSGSSDIAVNGSYCFYDSDKTYITGASSGLGRGVTAPSGAKYIRVGVKASIYSDAEDKYVFGEYDYVTALTEYPTKKINEKYLPQTVVIEFELEDGTTKKYNVFADEVST